MDITVVGRAKASVKPERATLHLTAGFETADKNEALTRTTALVGKLQAHIQSLEGAGASPITWQAVLPIQTWSQRPYSPAGTLLPARHLAQSRIKVKFRDFEVLSQFAAQVGGLAGVEMEQVEWALTEVSATALSAQVLKQAVEDAKARAVVMAQAAGAQGVTPLEIADPGLLSQVTAAGGAHGTPYGSTRVFAENLPVGNDMTGIDLAPEDVVIEASVHVRYTTT